MRRDGRGGAVGERVRVDLVELQPKAGGFPRYGADLSPTRPLTVPSASLPMIPVDRLGPKDMLYCALTRERRGRRKTVGKVGDESRLRPHAPRSTTRAASRVPCSRTRASSSTPPPLRRRDRPAARKMSRAGRARPCAHRAATHVEKCKARGHDLNECGAACRAWRGEYGAAERESRVEPQGYEEASGICSPPLRTSSASMPGRRRQYRRGTSSRLKAEQRTESRRPSGVQRSHVPDGGGGRVSRAAHHYCLGGLSDTSPNE